MIKYIKNIIWKYLPDKLVLKWIFYRNLGYKLNLQSPKTFNEKLQRLKLYDRKPEYTKLADKYLVKNIIAKEIGEEYVIPTLGVRDKFDDINFNELPNQFVLKCNHDSGGVIIVKDKCNFNKKLAKKKIDNAINSNFYNYLREWAYKDIKPKIIAEKYLEDKKYHELRDYKFFTFGGKCKIMFVATNRQGDGDTYFDFFDNKYNHLNIINGHHMNPNQPEKPESFEKMIKLAETLAHKIGDIPQLRIDFYEINGKIYFGEITFYHWSGMMPFKPIERDYKLGNRIKLPIDKN